LSAQGKGKNGEEKKGGRKKVGESRIEEVFLGQFLTPGKKGLGWGQFEEGWWEEN